VLVGVTSVSKPFFELMHRRRQDQEDDRIGALTPNLLGTLYLDLEQHVHSRGWVRFRRPVQIALEVSPLKKHVVVNRPFKRGAVDEVVFATVFARAS
jgi:hypothetical protein